MIPYLILVFVPFVFYYISIKKRSGKLCVDIGDSSEIKNNNCIIPVFFIIFVVLLALRHESIGRDIVKYEYYFDKLSGAGFSELLNSDWDILYVALNWLVGKFTDSFQVFLAVVAVITVAPLAVVYSQDKEYGVLKTMLFLNMPTFIMIFSGLRQSLAITMGVVAYTFVRKKKLGWFLLFAFIAWGFHHTAFMVFLLYPLYHYPLKKKHLIFVIPTFLVMFAFNRQIFTTATAFLSRIFGEEDYLVAIDNNGAYTMVVLFLMFAVISYFIPNEDEMDNESLGLRNFLLMAAILQCFAPIHMLAMRMNYYFIIFVPVAIGKCLKYVKVNLRDVAWVVKVVMILFFMAYYLYNTYRSCRTGISTLDIYPYRPFWS